MQWHTVCQLGLGKCVVLLVVLALTTPIGAGSYQIDDEGQPAQSLPRGDPLTLQS